MRRDAEILQGVERDATPATFRIFRFNAPTVSFGRLQKFHDIESLVPAGWTAVQRPTGGGIVFHEEDLCLSLCWPRGQSPLPASARDQYRWIHSVIQEAMGPQIRLACCDDQGPARSPFARRECFVNPVGYDLMNGNQKIAGGALAARKNAVLYQGSIQTKVAHALEPRLQTAFARRLMPS